MKKFNFKKISFYKNYIKIIFFIDTKLFKNEKKNKFKNDINIIFHVIKLYQNKRIMKKNCRKKNHLDLQQNKNVSLQLKIST